MVYCTLIITINTSTNFHLSVCCFQVWRGCLHFDAVDDECLHNVILHACLLFCSLPVYFDVPKFILTVKRWNNVLKLNFQLLTLILIIYDILLIQF